jgi:D-3-phosphoglycerate dehydrogenase / 2-oxoglutarate reductase
VPPLVPMRRLEGQVLGLIGFGHIPRALAPKAKAFGLTVIAHDPYLAPDVARAHGVEATSFEDLLARADFVSVHAPLSPVTRGLVNAAAFARMKKGACLINTARGPLVEEAALVAALDSGHLGGAGLDVLAIEPPGKASALLGRDNVIITPHAAFYSVEALDELQTKCASDVARVLLGEPPVYPVKAA